MNGEQAIIQERKAQLRLRMSGVRGTLPPEQHREYSEMACARAAGWLSHNHIRSMLVYVPFRSELDTKPLIEQAWQKGIAVYAPRCRREDCSMTLHRLRSWDELDAGSYGILEPNPLVSPAASEEFVPEAIFTPGMAFDRAGGRLGYGGGYYDRLHARIPFSEGAGKLPVWAGIGFEIQVVEEVPMEKTDARLQVLITEAGCLQINEEAEDGTDAF
ncbi:5-formyltetrahydrofolate cyclo-ligase [Paenibacillus chibensis]|uniref:5-formyltetrahydrofolate cyclo-ligase n=1 Tax=Paenibacillus chibensis TaxID=59846 RepID=A0ABU6PM75_9BACL|nr:5-formyltetrahydrofolate cyclo-ligase [Paenibacillus chibensis]